MGLPLLHLQNAYGQVTFSPYGATVLSYIPTGHSDVLWQTTEGFLQAAYAAGKPLRAGIPLCWPWFGKHPALPDMPSHAPSHGFARISPWQVVSHTAAAATLTLSTDGTNPAFPYRATARLEILLHDKLTVTLTTTSAAAQPFSLTAALHSYLAVDDIATTHVYGLAGQARQHVSSGAPLPPHVGPLGFTAETEALYLNPHWPLRVKNAARTIHINAPAGTHAVIWNPWAAKAASLDMPPASYQNMLCAEALHATPQVVLPGAQHTLSTALALAHP